jgi:hypothetical protein
MAARALLHSALWILRALGGFAVLLVVTSLVRGSANLVVFTTGTLLCGPAGLENFDRRAGQATYSLVGPLMWGALAATLLTVARRIHLKLDVVQRKADHRPPVVYLRSFTADKRLSRRPLSVGRLPSFRSEEEQMVEALREAGPVFALGKPGERLPRLGAGRVYVGEAEWRPQVLSWFDRAALVVMHIPASPTEGLAWEIEQGLQLVARDRLIFVVTSSAGAEWLARTLGERIPDALPSLHSGRGPYGSRVSGILHFARGRPEFRRLVKPPIFHRPFWAPLVPVYQMALRDVIARVNGFAQPLRPGFGDALAAAFGIGFIVAVAAATADTQALMRAGKTTGPCQAVRRG